MINVTNFLVAFFLFYPTFFFKKSPLVSHDQDHSDWDDSDGLMSFPTLESIRAVPRWPDREECSMVKWSVDDRTIGECADYPHVELALVLTFGRLICYQLFFHKLIFSVAIFPIAIMLMLGGRFS